MLGGEAFHALISFQEIKHKIARLGFFFFFYFVFSIPSLPVLAIRLVEFTHGYKRNPGVLSWICTQYMGFKRSLTWRFSLAFSNVVCRGYLVLIRRQRVCSFNLQLVASFCYELSSIWSQLLNNVTVKTLVMIRGFCIHEDQTLIQKSNMQ